MSTKSIQEKRLKILELLESGEISSEEALEMLDSLALYKEMKDFKKKLSSERADPGDKFIELQ